MIELRLFGQVEIRDETGAIDLASAKLLAILAVLAAAGDKPVSRETLTDLLWGSHFDEQARQNFRQALSRLRKLLGADALIADDQTVKLDRHHVSADIIRFDALKNGTDAAGLAAAAELARGDFLDGIAIREPAFTEWLAVERKRFGGELRKIRLRLAAMALAQKDAASALTHAEAILRHDALDEEAHRYKLQALATLGRKAEALKDHQAFAALLKAELGTGPEPATIDLVTALKSSPPPSIAAPGTARPSIAVMPFANLSPDPEQSYFADGMADELITALSRLPWLTVMSRGATFAFKDKPIDARQAGQEFSVGYVIEGSVRKAGSMVRITGQLIDTETGVTIWGAHFDGSLEKVFEFQDQVTAKVLGAIQPRLEHAELERSRRKPTLSLDAYDYYLRGLAEVHRWTRDGNREALKHFYRAIELDRRFGAAYGMAARCLSQRKTSSWVEDEAREKAEAEGLANLAVEFGRGDPVALAAAGIATAFVVGRVRDGGELIERSLEINPGYATAWMFRGWVKAWSGEADEAIASINRAIELSPYDPDPYVVSMRRSSSFAHFIGGRYEEAIACAELFVALPQNAITSTASAAASAALLGRMDVAKKAMAHLLLADPKLSQAKLRSRFPIVRDEDFNRLAEALRLAGLPE
jgi:TolB-like protein